MASQAIDPYNDPGSTLVTLETTNVQEETDTLDINQFIQQFIQKNISKWIKI